MFSADLATFEQTIYHNWASYFGQPASVVTQPGTTLLPESKYAGDKMVALWYIGAHTFVQLDPAYTAPLMELLATLPPHTALKAAQVQAAWGANARRFHEAGLVHYLYPPDLPDYTPPPPFQVRPLTEADAAPMAALQAACTPEEADEGFVEVTHEVAFGCWAGAQLVAAASGYERTGFLDIGVLTHPGFRRQGLGKAVVGALCAWAPGHRYLAQYRCNPQNANSANVARALNFRLYFRQESVGLE